MSLFETLENRALLSGSVLGFHARFNHSYVAAHHSSHHHSLQHHSLTSDGVTNTTPYGYTPAQIRHAYGLDQISGDGSGQTIAIVDAYNDPNVASDLSVFNSQFGLAQLDGKNGDGTLSVVKQGNTTTNSGWSGEIALDVEWAHAIAPKANIVLYEARTSSLSNLLSAVDSARNNSAVSAISMSWGGSEFSSESSYDYHFTTPSGHKPIVFTVASGDSGAPAEWPAVSPNVVAVGGTSLNLDSSGNYLGESAWSGSTGGVSAYENKPSYQSSLSYSKRSNPDVSWDADPNTGVAVYVTVSQNGQTGWFEFGGTSAGAPQMAGYVAIVDQQRASAGKTSIDGKTQLLPTLYSASSSSYHDIVTGKTTGSPNYFASTGYDLATGIGSIKADVLTPTLVNA